MAWILVHMRFISAWLCLLSLSVSGKAKEHSLASKQKGGDTVWTACRAADVPDFWQKEGGLKRGHCSATASIPGIVPGTVLEMLLLNGTFTLPGPDPQDPYYEQNLKLIPDIHDVGKEYYTFWFTTDVALPSEASSLWLQFKGINYRATAYADGQLLGSMATAFAEHWFQVPLSSAARLHMQLVVLVEPVDHVGNVTGGQGGDHMIARNAAVPQFSAGWDWIQGTPDRQTGIWDDVLLHYSKACSIRHPFVRTRSITFADGSRLLAPPQGFTNVSRREAMEEASKQPPLEATLEIGGLLVNSGSEELQVDFAIDVITESGHRVALAKTLVRLQPFETLEKQEVFADFRGLQSQPLHLWWPHTHGDYHLYTAEASIYLHGDTAKLASKEFQFGIRILDAIPDPSGSGSYAFRCNGRPIFLTGGNWIATDQLLRFASNTSRYEAEVQLHQQMGLNALRVWGGGLAERDGFYDAADKMGMLVMQEFWMTGDNNGWWAGEHSWPDDHKLYLAAVQDTILRLRGRASLLFYCGGNELHPRGKSPSPEIAEGIKTHLQKIDPLRFYIESSMSPKLPDPSKWFPDYSLAPMDGPYGPLLVPTFWDPQPGLAAAYQNSSVHIPFQPEVGSFSQPTLRSMRRFLSNTSLGAFPKPGASEAASPPHTSWLFHKYLTSTTMNATANESYDHIYAYGKHVSIDAYCFAAQLAQRQQYQALYEGFTSGMWTSRTAIFMWKSQSPWPALRGGLYDYYLAPTGGYFGVRQALSEAVHVQLRWLRSRTETKWGVDIVSRLPSRLTNLTLHARWVSIYGASIENVSIASVSASPSSVTSVNANLSWPRRQHEESVLMLYLQLWDGLVIQSTNEYLLVAMAPRTPDYSELSLLRARPVDVHMELEGVTDACYAEPSRVAACYIQLGLELASNAPSVAFGLVLELVCLEAPPANDDRVLPVFVSDGYFSLEPGGRRSITISTRSLHMCEEPGIRAEGWNVRTASLPVKLDMQWATPQLSIFQ